MSLLNQIKWTWSFRHIQKTKSYAKWILNDRTLSNSDIKWLGEQVTALSS